MAREDIYFLDTNVVIGACEFIRVQKSGGNPESCKVVYDSLVELVNSGHKVYISPISIAELCFRYHRWFYQIRKGKELAPFDEIFGRGATWETTEEDRVNADQLIEDFILEGQAIGIELSRVDQTDVMKLARVLYKYSSPAVESYDIGIYANAILENAKYILHSDKGLSRVIDSVRKNYKNNIINDIILLFGEDKYPFIKSRKDLPCTQKPHKKQGLINKAISFIKKENPTSQ
jgi:hypothetical protein